MTNTPIVTIYSTSTCTTCEVVTNWLEEHSIAYKKIITDQEPDGVAQLLKASGGMISVPFTVISTADKPEVKVAGFDKKVFESALL